jgi:nitrogen regulatory protein P-II 1
MSSSARQLLVAVVKGHRRVELVMEGFLELGVPGATVLDAKGMGQIVSTELPIFSGFRSLFPGGGEESYLILSVLTMDQADEAIGMLRDVCGDFVNKGTGIVFTLPVTGFVGPGSAPT